MRGYSKCLLACLLQLAGMSSLSAAPASQATGGSIAIVGDLPSLVFKPTPGAYRLVLKSTAPTTRATPMLDRLFADHTSPFARRHSYQVDLGSVTLGVEGLRLQDRAADWMSRLDATRRRQTFSSFAARSDFAIGSTDRLSIGLATAGDHSLQLQSPVSQPRLATGIKTLGLSWLHGGQWLTSLGWRQVSGISHGGTDRRIELASGAPLHETGMRVSLAFLPGGASDPRGTGVGIEARRAALSPGDLAVIGANQRQDMQAGLFLRTRF